MVAYFMPDTLDAALALLAERPDLVLLAGATDVYPAKATRAGWGHMTHGDILDISRIAALRGITDGGDHWWIGATTTWDEISRAELPAIFDGLKAAAREIGGAQIQNRGTLGGNLCTASPAGDSIPCLMALDAVVEVAPTLQPRLSSWASRDCVPGTTCPGPTAPRARSGVRGTMGPRDKPWDDNGSAKLLPVASFFTGYRTTVVSGGAGIVTGVRIPKRKGVSAFVKLGARRYLVISMAMVAGVFEIGGDGTIAHAAISVGACSAIAQRLAALEAALIGQRPDAALARAEHLAHLTPIDDIRASADYRRAAALQLVRDMLARLAADRAEAA